MIVNKAINQNVQLHYVEDLRNVHNAQTDAYDVVEYLLVFRFYKEHTYRVTVTREDLDADTPSVLLEGPSELFDSFERLCENNLWEEIGKYCDAYDAWIREIEEDFDSENRLS